MTQACFLWIWCALEILGYILSLLMIARLLRPTATDRGERGVSESSAPERRSREVRRDRGTSAHCPQIEFGRGHGSPGVAWRGAKQALGEAPLAGPKRGEEALLVDIRQQDLAHSRLP